MLKLHRDRKQKEDMKKSTSQRGGVSRGGMVKSPRAHREDGKGSVTVDGMSLT